MADRNGCSPRALGRTSAHRSVTRCGVASAAAGNNRIRAVRAPRIMATLAIDPELNGARTAQHGSQPLALYVHWTFCVSKCPYCDFNSHVRASIDQDDWRKALLADLAHEAALLPNHRLSSIFFGGGTPSLMDPAVVEAVIDAARNHWPQADDLEITLEANSNSAEAADRKSTRLNSSHVKISYA